MSVLITLYQDKKDDEKAGVKSMAVRLGDGIRPALSVFDATFFACLLWAGYLNGQHLPFYVMSVIAPFLLCLWHIWSFDHNDPRDSWKKFTVRLIDITTSWFWYPIVVQAGRHGAALVCAGLVVDHYCNLVSLAIWTCNFISGCIRGDAFDHPVNVLITALQLPVFILEYRFCCLIYKDEWHRHRHSTYYSLSLSFFLSWSLEYCLYFSIYKLIDEWWCRHRK